MFTYDEIDKKLEDAKELVKQQLMELEAKNKEFVEVSKRAMDTANVQEVSSALSSIFKDGFGVFNKVIENLRTHFNQQEINKLKEKEGLLDTIMDEWKNKGKLEEDIKTKLAKSGDVAEKFLNKLDSEILNNKELLGALSIISKFSESMKEEKEVQQEANQEEKEVQQEANQTAKSQSRSKNRQRNRA